MQSMKYANSYKNLNKVIGKLDIWVCWIRQKSELSLDWNKQWPMQKHKNLNKLNVEAVNDMW